MNKVALRVTKILGHDNGWSIVNKGTSVELKNTEKNIIETGKIDAMCIWPCFIRDNGEISFVCPTIWRVVKVIGS